MSGPEMTVTGVQIPVQKLRDLKKIKLQLKQKIPFEGREIRGCCILSNGNIIFSDYGEGHECLLIYNKEGSLTSTIPLSPVSAFDVVCIKDGTVAVTAGNKKSISVVDTVSNKVVKTIKTDTGCYGVTNKDGKIIFCAEGVGLNIYSETENVVTLFHNDKSIEQFSNITCFRDKICYTNPHTITLIDSHGKKMFKIRDDNLIRSPRGIAMDEFMNVYLVGMDSHNLVVVSPDGKEKLQLLCRKDNGLEYPTALYRDNRQFVISGGFGGAFVFVMK